MEATQTRKNSLNGIRKEIQKYQIILIISVTLFLSAGGMVINVISNDKSLDQNLQNTAESLARVYVSARRMDSPALALYFDSIQKNLSEVDVISIVDERNIRVYHTHHELIGSTYNGTSPDFQKHQKGFYTQNEIGPSGAQRRAYCEIYDLEGNYCGFIMAIILRTSIRSATQKTAALFAVVMIFSIIIELIISRTVSKKIKQKLMGYEPDVFSSMFRIRDNILESINDGIIAVNNDMNVQFINKPALKILKCNDIDEKINGIKQAVFSQKVLEQTIQTGTSTYNLQEKTADGTEVLVDCIPIKEQEAVRGAVAILHDRSEYTKLMEDLSGTKYLVDSMRANNHDFTNKLHVILGLIQIGHYDQAVKYIENISIIQRETISTVMHSIENPSFAALLIGKIARASECNVRFVLREGSQYKNSHVTFPSEALITIAGNLIENAIDAMNMDMRAEACDVKELVFGVFTKPDSLLITVDDTGPGIRDEDKQKIFTQGFSTKGSGRGIGLFHTKQLVESLGGIITFESQYGVGTNFMVSFSGMQCLSQ